MATVDSLIERIIAIGDLKAAQAEAYGGQAVNDAQGTIVIEPQVPSSAPSVSEPSVYLPYKASGIDMTVFDSKHQEIIEDLSDRFANFLIEYFPIDADLTAAVEDWLLRAVNGGTGINAVVEGQIWNRARDRIMSDSRTAMDDAIAAFAARGFPLPPGAANASVAAIISKRSTDTAAISRDAAIKAFETEIENVRFAVKTAIDYRVAAVQAAGDFIRALAIAPQIASALSTQSADAQARLISAATGLFNARINKAELIQKNNIVVAATKMQAKVESAQLNKGYVDTRARVAADVVQSLGQQASAALNAASVNVSKSVSAD